MEIQLERKFVILDKNINLDTNSSYQLRWESNLEDPFDFLNQNKSLVIIGVDGKIITLNQEEGLIVCPIFL